MPASRQSRSDERQRRYSKLLDESIAIVQARDFSSEELAQTAEDAFARIPGAVMVPIDNIEPNPDNPRQAVGAAAMADLAASIAERGLLHPLVVRRHAGHPGQYIVIAGSRRLLAARLVHADQDEAVRGRVGQIPCVIRETSETDAFADALLENLARADLSRAEMMEALLRLSRDYGWSASLIARRTGRNQSDISQLLGVARHPALAQLVRQEIIKPTVAGEINRLPEPMREATIAEVRAGAVRTVADVRRRRPAPPAAGQTPDVGGIGQGPEATATAGRPTDAPPGGAGRTPPAREAGAGVVISLPLATAPTALEDQLEGIRALAAMVEATSGPGRALLAAVGADLAMAYARLATYLRREG